MLNRIIYVKSKSKYLKPFNCLQMVLVLLVFYSLHNGIALLHKYPSTRASDRVHQSLCGYASPVVGSHFSRPCCSLNGSGRECLISGNTSGLKGPSHQALTLFGRVKFITWRLRRIYLGECRQSPRYFWDCWTRLGYGPVIGPT